MERLCRLDHFIGGIGNQVVGLEQQIHCGLGQEIAILVCAAYRSSLVVS